MVTHFLVWRRRWLMLETHVRTNSYKADRFLGKDCLVDLVNSGSYLLLSVLMVLWWKNLLWGIISFLTHLAALNHSNFKFKIYWNCIKYSSSWRQIYLYPWRPGTPKHFILMTNDFCTRCIEVHHSWLKRFSIDYWLFRRNCMGIVGNAS